MSETVKALRLGGRVALVTGAAQGLGAAIAARLAREGCRAVVVADVQTDRIRTVAEDLSRDTTAKTLALTIDVTNEEQVIDMVERTLAEFGSLDVVVANAGILRADDITEMSMQDWRAVLDVNLTGYFLTAREAARVMVTQGRGAIIQVNSKSGKKGSFRNSAYAASKFGGIGLTQSIALDLAPYGIRVNAVCPGNLLDGTLWQDSLLEMYARVQGRSREEVRRHYETQVPLGRACTYDDVCNAVIFLASDEAAYMTGQALNVTGGQEMR